jgi:Uma2 family endonuclease
MMKPCLILPRDELKQIIRRRRHLGIDQRDEVWNGVYVMPPPADNEHQDLSWRLTSAIDEACDHRQDIRFLPGIAVTDRADKWRKNFRCPDVAIFLPGNPAEDRKTHWLGGPDFAVEIISPGDRSRKKLDFYAKVGVRELLLVEREPWRLELYRALDGKLERAGLLEPGSTGSILSDVLSVSFRLLANTPRPQIEVMRPSDRQVWIV